MPAPRLDRLAPPLFVFLWSTGFIGTRLGIPHADPLAFLLVRYAIVISAMLLLALVTRAPWPASPQDFFHIGVSGVLVHGLYLGGVYTAMSRGLPTALTSLVTGLQPILGALGAGLLLRERVAPRQWAGLLLGLAGVVLVLSGKLSLAAAAGGRAGALLPAFLALAGITLGTLYQKRFCRPFDLRTGAVVQFVPAALATLPLALAARSFRIDWTGEFVFAMAWLVLVLSIGAISLLNLLIRHGTAVNVARLFFLVPPATALLAWLIFGETLPIPALAGMGLAAAGVHLARPMSG